MHFLDVMWVWTNIWLHNNCVNQQTAACWSGHQGNLDHFDLSCVKGFLAGTRSWTKRICLPDCVFVHYSIGHTVQVHSCQVRLVDRYWIPCAVKLHYLFVTDVGKNNWRLKLTHGKSMSKANAWYVLHGANGCEQVKELLRDIHIIADSLKICFQQY